MHEYDFYPCHFKIERIEQENHAGSIPKPIEDIWILESLDLTGL
jgi:hypothetical protein